MFSYQQIVTSDNVVIRQSEPRDAPTLLALLAEPRISRALGEVNPGRLGAELAGSPTTIWVLVETPKRPVGAIRVHVDPDLLTSPVVLFAVSSRWSNLPQTSSTLGFVLRQLADDQMRRAWVIWIGNVPDRLSDAGSEKQIEIVTSGELDLPTVGGADKLRVWRHDMPDFDIHDAFVQAVIRLTLTDDATGAKLLHSRPQAMWAPRLWQSIDNVIPWESDGNAMAAEVIHANGRRWIGITLFGARHGHPRQLVISPGLRRNRRRYFSAIARWDDTSRTTATALREHLNETQYRDYITDLNDTPESTVTAARNAIKGQTRPGPVATMPQFPYDLIDPNTELRSRGGVLCGNAFIPECPGRYRLRRRPAPAAERHTR